MLKRHHRPYLYMREKIDTLCSFAKEIFNMNASEREEKLPEVKDVIDNYIDMLMILEIMEKLFSEPECCQMEVWELDFLEEMNRKYHIGEKYD